MKKQIKKSIDFYDRNIEQYMKKTIGLQDVSWLRSFVSKLNRGDKILDVGCGFGRDVMFFLEQGLDVYGIDLSAKMVEMAKEYEPQGKYFIMDVEEMSFEDNFFNGIWCSAVLYHFKKSDLHDVFTEIKRVLKKDGILYLNLKQGKGQKFIKDDRFGGDRRFSSFYLEGEIKKILTAENFALLDFEISVEFEDDYKDTGLIYIIARKK